jgi:hypothetical protein
MSMERRVALAGLPSETSPASVTLWFPDRSIDLARKVACSACAMACLCIQHENRARRETYEMRQPRVSDTAASELDLRELRAPVQRHCYANWPEWISFWPTGKRPKGLWTVLSVPIRSRRAAEPGAAGGSSGTPTARRTYRDQRGRSGKGRSGPQESPSRIRGERGSTRPKVIDRA